MGLATPTNTAAIQLNGSNCNLLNVGNLRHHPRKGSAASTADIEPIRDVEMVELHASKDGVCDMRITSKSIEAPTKSSPPGIKVSQVGETLKVDIEQGSQ